MGPLSRDATICSLLIIRLRMRTEQVLFHRRIIESAFGAGGRHRRNEEDRPHRGGRRAAGGLPRAGHGAGPRLLPGRGGSEHGEAASNQRVPKTFESCQQEWPF